MKCLICQRAIDKGEIPASLAKNKDSWYTKYDFDRYFNVRGPTLNKWVRSGILKARTVSHYGKGVHTQVFLINDNKDFLPPKKLLESKRARVVEKRCKCLIGTVSVILTNCSRDTRLWITFEWYHPKKWHSGKKSRKRRMKLVVSIEKR